MSKTYEQNESPFPILSEHLCDLYLTGGLKPIGSEMKYHLDSYVPSISKELVDPPPPPANSSFNHFGGESDLRIASSTSSVMPIIGSSSTRSPLKRRNREGAASASASSMSPAKSSRLSSTSSSLPVVDVSNGGDFEAVDASMRDSERTSSSSAVVKRLDVVKHEAEDEDIFLIDDDEDTGGGGVVKGDLNHSDLDFSAVDFNSTGEMQHQRHHHHQMDLDSLNSAAFDESHDSVSNSVDEGIESSPRLDSYMAEIRNFLASSPKAAALRAMSLEVREELGSKGSAAYRIMTSLIYELGTMAACRVLNLPVQHPFVRIYRSAILQQLVDAVPIFAALDDAKFCLFEGAKRKSIMSFLKETLNRFFRNRLTKRDHPSASKAVRNDGAGVVARR